MNQTWRLKAACKTQTKLFFPAEEKKTVSYKEALAICDACEVKTDCLKYAVSYEMMHGVWGGTTPNQNKNFKTFNIKFFT
jgi:WhiB family redox-sensing transcriptional regulator